MAATDNSINIFALGGLGEVGKNTYCFESSRSIILVDAGVRFPEANLPGVDYVIPDYSFLRNNRAKFKALFITHGHEDHIGGIPFLARTIHIPVIYAPRLAAALIRHKLEEHRIKDNIVIREVKDGETIDVGGDFKVTFFQVTHSIPDSFGLCIDTSEGRIIETGDFKVDLTPVGPNFNIAALSRFGTEGVDLLMADSTNAEIEGYTPSETAVRSGLREVFEKAPGRIIVSTFSSNINRIQQVVQEAVDNGRKICILGRSMENVVGIAREYGIIKIPDESIIEDKELRNYRGNEICILCTGSQGEEMAALSRIARGEHKHVHIQPMDTVVFSSNPIPGNGALVDRLVNSIVKQGADVRQNGLAFSLHSSGHPSKQELRLIQRLANPRYFMPVHGEYRMLRLHGEIAEQCGLPKDRIFLCKNGDILTLRDHKVTRGGRIPEEDVYIDGNDLEGLSGAVMRERGELKNDGLVAIIVGLGKDRSVMVPPLVYARGFALGQDSHVMRHAQIHAREALDRIIKKRPSNEEVKAALRQEVERYIYRKTARTPMVVPLLMNEGR